MPFRKRNGNQNQTFGKSPYNNTQQIDRHKHPGRNNRAGISGSNRGMKGVTNNDAIGGMAEFKPITVLEISMRSIETASKGIIIPMLAPDAVIEAIRAVAERHITDLLERGTELFESTIT